jgi:hypothetical protein
MAFIGTFNGTGAGNAMEIQWGGVTCATLSGQGASVSKVEVVIVKAASNSQYATATLTQTTGAVTLSSTTTLAATDTADITVLFRAKVQSGATFTQYFGIVEALTV